LDRIERKLSGVEADAGRGAPGAGAQGERAAGRSGPPPWWAVIGTLLAAPLFVGALLVYVPYTLTAWRADPGSFGWPLLRWVGAVLIALSIPIELDFLVRFVSKGHGTPVPVAPPSRLVTSGSFRFVRNPAYLAAVAVLVGQGLWFGSGSVLAYALGMAVAFHLFVVGHEEPTLRRKFGADYDAYCRRVSRWIPRIPPRA
jgi:protein-S-isoprenylcysteine O-methyltransferase Ste14